VNILYYGGCWPTNIGNAFIDLGSMYTIKAASPNSRLFFASELPRWILRTVGRPMDYSIDLADLIEADVVVVSGMTLCDEFVEVEGPVLSRLSTKGTKIVFNGCGGSSYSHAEMRRLQEFMRTLNISGFISRDDASSRLCEDCSAESLSGIDCGFFLPEAFTPAPLSISNFVVCNFDTIAEPPIDSRMRIIRVHHSCLDVLDRGSSKRRGTSASSSLKLLAKASWYGYKRDLTSHAGTLVSDIPEDYLNLYAKAYATYSDRVHAIVAALSYGNYARLYSESPRAKLFDRVGCESVTERLTRLDLDQLKTEKKAQIRFLRRVL